MIILGPAVFGKDLSTLENLELSVLALWFAVVTFLLVEQPTLRLRFGLKRWLGVAAMMSAVVMALSLCAVALAPTVQGSGRVAAALDLDSPASQRLDARRQRPLTDDVRDGIRFRRIVSKISFSVAKAEFCSPSLVIVSCP